MFTYDDRTGLVSMYTNLLRNKIHFPEELLGNEAIISQGACQAQLEKFEKNFGLSSFFEEKQAVMRTWIMTSVACWIAIVSVRS
jgi:hypothetical protein